MFTYTLSPADIRLANKLAQARNDNKLRLGATSNKVSNWSDQSIHLLGVAAEIAVARVFRVEPDKAIYAGGDRGYDLVAQGRTWDVKMRSRANRDLIIMPGLSDFLADYVILCWPAGCRGGVSLVGFVGRERFRVEARDDLIPNRLVMPWQQLTKWR